MTEREIQGKWLQVRNSGLFEITEFELAGSNCSFQLYVEVKAFVDVVGDVAEIETNTRYIFFLFLSGLIRCAQPNTYDTSFFGVTTFTCTLYHCALR